jgi:hypothetical protein
LTHPHVRVPCGRWCRGAEARGGTFLRHLDPLGPRKSPSFCQISGEFVNPQTGFFYGQQWNWGYWGLPISWFMMIYGFVGYKSRYNPDIKWYKPIFFYSPNSEITRSGGLFSGDPTKRWGALASAGGRQGLRKGGVGVAANNRIVQK